MKLQFLEPSIKHIQHKKSTVISKNYGGILAESKGFEPLWRCRLTVFKTAPL